MLLQPGERLGPYEILGPVGAGGMGEVYRARDTRLDRDVALKVIPASLASDPDRVARFEREAKVVAALSHPNILTVHDTGAAGNTLYLVMELLAGETLGSRLLQGPLPVRKACEVGSLVARGLSAAHDKGLVHRDLKPDNIFLTDNGQVKILDFGLAREITSRSGVSETRAAITDAGAVLGTVGYMAPEQVRGQTADARADLFALGAVLYEMLTGRRAFARGTAAETMTAILNEDAPDPPSDARALPPALDRIVRHCLEKNPSERFQTARDVAFALDSLSGSSQSGTAIPVSASSTGRRWERLAWAAVTMALAAVAGWLALARPQGADVPMEAYRATLLLPEGVSMPPTVLPGGRFAISPDGQKLAFIGNSQDRQRGLWIQNIADRSATLIERTPDAVGPFWSPDSRTVAFFVARQLMKVDASGGRPIPIAPVTGSGAWSPDGQTILVADERDGIRAISVADGVVRRLVEPKVGLIRFYPEFLAADGRYMFGEIQNGFPNTYGWFESSLADGAASLLHRAVLDRDRSNARVAARHVLSVRDANLLARPLDQLAAGLDSGTTLIASAVESESRGSASFSVSDTVLVYQGSVNANRSSLLWFTDTGQQLSQLGEDGGYSNLELSPDGTRLLVSLPDGVSRFRDIWMIDTVRGVPTRVTSDPADERSAVWSADGKSIVYRGRDAELYTRPLEGGSEQPFVIDKRSKDPRGWSADGKFFLFRSTDKGNDLWVKPAATGMEPYPFISTEFGEAYGEFSPDGKWVAYVSDESGAQEVYVTSFPSGQGKVRVSSNGGQFARWRQDGRELYFLGTDNKMMAAAVAVSGNDLTVTSVRELFQSRAIVGPGTPFVVSRDGKRFLINSTIPSTDPPSLNVIFNWPALLKKK